MSDDATRRACPRPGELARSDRTVEFETLYRDNVGAITSYFARRTSDPQVAADLTADTFVAAIRSLGTFDPGRGSPRGWLFGVAKNCYARHCEGHQREADGVRRLGHRRELSPDETADLLDRIDAEAPGRRLLAALDVMPAADRAAVALVYVDGLRPKEAAQAMGVSAGAMRLRLFRARTKMRQAMEHGRNDHGQ